MIIGIVIHTLRRAETVAGDSCEDGVRRTAVIRLPQAAKTRGDEHFSKRCFRVNRARCGAAGKRRITLPDARPVQSRIFGAPESSLRLRIHIPARDRIRHGDGDTAEIAIPRRCKPAIFIRRINDDITRMIEHARIGSIDPRARSGRQQKHTRRGLIDTAGIGLLMRPEAGEQRSVTQDAHIESMLHKVGRAANHAGRHGEFHREHAEVVEIKNINAILGRITVCDADIQLPPGDIGTHPHWIRAALAGADAEVVLQHIPGGRARHPPIDTGCKFRCARGAGVIRVRIILPIDLIDGVDEAHGSEETVRLRIICYRVAVSAAKRRVIIRKPPALAAAAAFDRLHIERRGLHECGRGPVQRRHHRRFESGAEIALTRREILSGHVARIVVLRVNLLPCRPRARRVDAAMDHRIVTHHHDAAVHRRDGETAGHAVGNVGLHLGLRPIHGAIIDADPAGDDVAIHR